MHVSLGRVRYTIHGRRHQGVRTAGRCCRDVGPTQLNATPHRWLCCPLPAGLAYLHAQRTVHRDVKGANLLVEKSGRIKLADFGMAKQMVEQVR